MGSDAVISIAKDQPSTPDFRTFFESMPGLYLVLGRKFQIIAMSDAYLRAGMTTREEILGREIFEVFTDDPSNSAATGVANLRASLERVLHSGRADVMALHKYDIRRPDAAGGAFEERYWSTVNSPVLGGDGRVEYIIHKVEDVTDFVRLQQAGQEQKQNTVALQTQATRMEAEVYLRAQQVAVTNRQLRAANQELARLYQQVALLMRRADDALTVGTELTPDDDVGFALYSMKPEEMLGRVGDLITEHKKLEDQLRQSQKMEALGRLAGSVAHDFNNLLTVIRGHSLLLLREWVGHPVHSKLTEIDGAARRATALTGQLLAFSRKQVLQPRLVDVNGVVAGTEDLLRRLIGAHITVTNAPGSGLGRVKADPTQLEMVIMNLAINARDAMPDGGRLTIATGSVSLMSGQVFSLDPKEYVAISITDTGHGMDAATVAHVFEPFFTTKPVGKGTGLGLSTARDFAEQSGGAITVDSMPGRGTTIRVYLPVAVDAMIDVEEVPAEQPIPPSYRTGSILVVEDHLPLQRLISTILNDAGYHVLTAANGNEASRIASNDAIDLVLTDVLMPEMDGPALIKHLRAQSQNPRVVFMSGHEEGTLCTNGMNSHFLQKPFTPKALLEALSHALHAPS